jgi:hypothetical protein
MYKYNHICYNLFIYYIIIIYIYTCNQEKQRFDCQLLGDSFGGQCDDSPKLRRCEVWMSMQQMLAWQPANPADANQEFEAAVGWSMCGRKRQWFSGL